MTRRRTRTRSRSTVPSAARCALHGIDAIRDLELPFANVVGVAGVGDDKSNSAGHVGEATVAPALDHRPGWKPEFELRVRDLEGKVGKLRGHLGEIALGG